MQTLIITLEITIVIITHYDNTIKYTEWKKYLLHRYIHKYQITVIDLFGNAHDVHHEGEFLG